MTRLLFLVILTFQLGTGLFVVIRYAHHLTESPRTAVAFYTWIRILSTCT